MNLNTHYMIIFKNPRDVTQVAYLARQMFPKHSQFLTESFLDATSIPFGYLFIDLKPDVDDRLRVRTGILPEELSYVYEPK